MDPSYYDILGVEPSATVAEFRAAYRQRISKAHPDRGGGHDGATRIQEAYDCLSDPVRRAMYDDGVTATESDLYGQAEAVLEQLFEHAIEELSPDADLVAEISVRIARSTATLRSQLSMKQRKVTRLKRYLNRIKTRSEQTNLFERVIKERIETAQAERNSARTAIEIHMRVAALLANYVDEGPTPAEPDIFRLEGTTP
jgi:curved DNA-binding protein CbpA